MSPSVNVFHQNQEEIGHYFLKYFLTKLTISSTSSTQIIYMLRPFFCHPTGQYSSGQFSSIFCCSSYIIVSFDLSLNFLRPFSIISHLLICSFSDFIFLSLTLWIQNFYLVFLFYYFKFPFFPSGSFSVNSLLQYFPFNSLHIFSLNSQNVFIIVPLTSFLRLLQGWFLLTAFLCDYHIFLFLYISYNLLFYNRYFG